MTSAADTPARDAATSLRIVQCARAIGPGFGVAGPAYNLEREFERRGHTCERFTLADLGIRSAAEGGSAVRATLALWRDVVAFSTLGTAGIWWRHARRRDGRTVIISHVDAVIGDVFVVRSLHKAYLARQPHRRWRLLRNPLHGFVLLRDAIRFRGAVHPRIVALSETNAAELRDCYRIDPARLRVIPNGVDCRRFRPSDAWRAEIRSALGVPPDDLVVAFVSNEFARKGLHVLLDAMQQLNGSMRGTRLLVAGQDDPGPYRTQVEGLAGRVHFLGHRQDIERILAASDVFVLPTLHDVAPLAGLEAMAAGLPLLMSALGGIQDYLREGDNGWFIDRDPAGLARRLSRLAAEPELRLRMGRRSRALAESHDWSVVAERFLEVIAELVAERRPERNA